MLKKAVAETYPLGVWLYNFTEPFLHPNLPEMVRVPAHDRALLQAPSESPYRHQKVSVVVLPVPEVLFAPVRAEHGETMTHPEQRQATGDGGCERRREK
jgi:hypothetical protein